MTEPSVPPEPSPCAGFDNPGDCRDAAAELHTFLDGALTEERRALIAGHLDSCAGCFDAYEFHAELKHVISQRCQCEVPEELRQRIRVSLAELAAGDLDPPSG